MRLCTINDRRRPENLEISATADDVVSIRFTPSIKRDVFERRTYDDVSASSSVVEDERLRVRNE